MIVIGIGANLTSLIGPPEMTIRESLKEIALRGVKLRAVSSLYATPAWPDPRDPDFVNAVAELETPLAPDELMALLQNVETRFGRVRTRPNAPRTLDLDVLDYNGVVRGANPVLPHPRMDVRGFVLVPLAEIAPAWHHPVSGKTVNDLLGALPDEERRPTKLAPFSTSKL